MPLSKKNPTTTNSWKQLIRYKKDIEHLHLRELFSRDSKRFSRMNIRWNDFLIDYSKNILTQEIIDLLLNFSSEMNIKEAIEAFFSGEKINETENRAVLHTALRCRKNKPIYVDGKNVMPEVNEVLEQMKRLTNSILSGEYKGYTGKEIQTIINIGIGGSELGPLMVSEALKYYKTRLDIRFVSNVDATHLTETLKTCKPETTFFIITSKTFTTQETMTNAESAKKWFLKYAKKEKYINSHFIAISTNKQKVIDFGIDPKTNMLRFWNWIVGRYSVWGATGISVCLSIGFDKFEEFLTGAHEMDEHFRSEAFHKNIPVLLALIGIWNRNFLNCETETILPYDQYLHRFPAYIQQASMESNGKSIDRSGKKANYSTGAILWGEAGTNGQHTFYQLIHQGTSKVPCDFILPVISQNPKEDHHQKLTANFLAQTQALAFGNTLKEAIKKLCLQGLSEERAKLLAPYALFEGNIPSNSIMIKKLTPKNLGSLIAMYEHKIFVQGVLWNIYSFDQWGVELGKQLAKKVLKMLKTKKTENELDTSTLGLINQIHHWNK